MGSGNSSRPSVPSPTPSSLALSSSASTTSPSNKPPPPHPASLLPAGLGGSPYTRFPPDHYPGHPSFGGYPPRLHPPSRHPPPLHAGAGGRPPLPPGVYGAIPHGAYPPMQSPHHPGVLRGPPHDLYKPPPPPHAGGHSSPSHHPQLLSAMKGYPGMEHLNYPGSPGRHHSPHQSPIPGSPSVGDAGEDPERHPPPNVKRSDRAEPGEFSSGLLSYFSSQREDDME